MASRRAASLAAAAVLGGSSSLSLGARLFRVLLSPGHRKSARPGGPCAFSIAGAGLEPATSGVMSGLGSFIPTYSRVYNYIPDSGLAQQRSTTINNLVALPACNPGGFLTLGSDTNSFLTEQLPFWNGQVQLDLICTMPAIGDLFGGLCQTETPPISQTTPEKSDRRYTRESRDR